MSAVHAKAAYEDTCRYSSRTSRASPELTLYAAVRARQARGKGRLS